MDTPVVLEFMGYDNPSHDNVILFGPDGTLERCMQTFYKEPGLSSPHAEISIFKQSPGVYTIYASETTPSATFSAYGKVEVTAGGYLVNGVLNGPLYDKYDDYFLIFPKHYHKFFTNQEGNVLAAALAMEPPLACEAARFDDYERQEIPEEIRNELDAFIKVSWAWKDPLPTVGPGWY
jgi:hypothetical protein